MIQATTTTTSTTTTTTATSTTISTTVPTSTVSSTFLSDDQHLEIEFRRTDFCFEFNPSTATVDYTGRLSLTKSGKECHFWNGSRYSDQEANFCRSPDHDENGVWCYCDDCEEDWEYCEVPSCHGSQFYEVGRTA